MGETVDGHDFRVVGVGKSGRFDDAVRAVGNADDVLRDSAMLDRWVIHWMGALVVI
jgi:hypothetical protein